MADSLFQNVAYRNESESHLIDCSKMVPHLSPNVIAPPTKQSIVIIIEGKRRHTMQLYTAFIVTNKKILDYV